MENKNALILGLIRQIVDYGEYPSDISPESLGSIFGTHHLPKDWNEPSTAAPIDISEFEFLRQQLESQIEITKMLSQQLIEVENKIKSSSMKPHIIMTDTEKESFNRYVYQSIHASEKEFNDIFSDYRISKAGEQQTFTNMIYCSHAMGLHLLFVANYQGTNHPPVWMSLFMRLLINKIFDTHSTNDKYKFQIDIFNQKIHQLFDEAKKLNYELSICAIEPFWAKMFFYTNGIPLFYHTKENQIDDFTIQTPTSPISSKMPYKEFVIDYTKNITFYLPSFSASKDSVGREILTKLKEVLWQVSKYNMEKQSQEIQSVLQETITNQSSQSLNEFILIFRV